MWRAYTKRNWRVENTDICILSQHLSVKSIAEHKQN